jgi:hypothetical protein
MLSKMTLPPREALALASELEFFLKSQAQGWGSPDGEEAVALSAAMATKEESRQGGLFFVGTNELDNSMTGIKFVWSKYESRSIACPKVDLSGMPAGICSEDLTKRWPIPLGDFLHLSTACRAVSEKVMLGLVELVFSGDVTVAKEKMAVMVSMGDRLTTVSTSLHRSYASIILNPFQFMWSGEGAVALQRIVRQPQMATLLLAYIHVTMWEALGVKKGDAAQLPPLFATTIVCMGIPNIIYGDDDVLRLKRRVGAVGVMCTETIFRCRTLDYNSIKAVLTLFRDRTWPPEAGDFSLACVKAAAEDGDGMNGRLLLLTWDAAALKLAVMLIVDCLSVFIPYFQGEFIVSMTRLM